METLIDINELGRVTNIKTATLRKYVAQRKVPFVKVGRLVRFRLSEIENWVISCAASENGESPAETTRKKNEQQLFF
jgi:excisionase family DNA binding protein